ncbi:segregation/condensation protein A [Tumebacillus algifaecis]|uniref:Segregation and condensation protein A n=1 Tax=Tumebacillus algifaecis TaxID=1214604 RepID=A0A223D176_9BACL|nr:segregation/condensation protein A [Tumebacillus algifaecis]ASS75066.1 segregation/condensation protein A [Tumebacillus algifaecis]
MEPIQTDVLKLKLETFEGPLDLLLHLIDKAELEITDIPISQITDQYLSYLQTMHELNLEIASEFLVMASQLLAMKSGLLLPRPIELDVPLIDYDEEMIDPRQALMERLIEYKKYKHLAEDLKDREELRNQVFTRRPENLKQYAPEVEPNPVQGVSLFDLLDAFRKALQKAQPDEYVADIHREEMSLEGRMQEIMGLLAFKSGRISFSELLGGYQRRSELIVSFLALLELMKGKQVRCLQRGLFDEIIIEMYDIL